VLARGHFKPERSLSRIEFCDHHASLHEEEVNMRMTMLATVAAIGALTLAGPARAQSVAAQVANNPGLQKLLAGLAAGSQVSARVSLPLQIGFFDNQPALYITPEVGVDPDAGPTIVAAAQHIAVGFNANFIPDNFASLPGTQAVDDIFVFTNFTQGNVLSSAPRPAGPTNKDQAYTPLWQVNLVTWVSGARKELTSRADILAAARNGLVTIQKTQIIVECSVVFTPFGGLLPDADIIIKSPQGAAPR
jgi:hypothetical protein